MLNGKSLSVFFVLAAGNWDYACVADHDSERFIRTLPPRKKPTENFIIYDGRAGVI